MMRHSGNNKGGVISRVSFGLFLILKIPKKPSNIFEKYKK